MKKVTLIITNSVMTIRTTRFPTYLSIWEPASSGQSSPPGRQRGGASPKEWSPPRHEHSVPLSQSSLSLDAVQPYSEGAAVRLVDEAFDKGLYQPGRALEEHRRDTRALRDQDL